MSQELADSAHKKKYILPSVIFLIGARASGKSTVGAVLARSLGFSFVDTDSMVQNKAAQNVSQIVAAHGWEHFRELESLALRQACRPATENATSAIMPPLMKDGTAGTVVATGGGIILAPENRTFMRSQGRVFYLHAPPTLLAQRLANNPQSSLRPSLTGKALQDEVVETLAQRLPLYRATAHHEVDATLSPSAAVEAMRHYLARSLA